MISCEASSSIFKSLAPGFTSQRNPSLNSIISTNSNISSFPTRNNLYDFSALVRSHSTGVSDKEERSLSKRRLYACSNGGGERALEVSEGEREVWGREVHCEVEVISWRERRIRGKININADVESVWNALTDYERLADLIPNLVCSGRIPCPHPGRIWLEQRGLQRALYWHIESNDCELHFSMVDGDFKKFEGKWFVKSSRRKSLTALAYEVSVIPGFNFPAIFLERIINSDLPVNLRALACRAESNFKGIAETSIMEDTFSPTSVISYTDEMDADTLDLVEHKKSFSSSSFGTMPQTLEVNGKWVVFGKVCSLDHLCMVDEIHLRRFDGLLVIDLVALIL